MKHHSRNVYLNALGKLVTEMGFKGSATSMPDAPAVESIDLNHLLWIQVMTGDKKGARLSLELGADANFQLNHRSLLQLAKAFSHQYGPEMVDVLEQYGAQSHQARKKLQPKKT